MSIWEEILIALYLPLLLFVPIYALFIWQFYHPKKAIAKGQVTLLRGYDQTKPKRAIELRRWRHNPKDEADITGEEIKQARVSAAAGIIFLTIIIIFTVLIANYQ